MKVLDKANSVFALGSAWTVLVTAGSSWCSLLVLVL